MLLRYSYTSYGIVFPPSSWDTLPGKKGYVMEIMTEDVPVGVVVESRAANNGWVDITGL